jgi:hypothetical protein
VVVGSTAAAVVDTVVVAAVGSDAPWTLGMAQAREKKVRIEMDRGGSGLEALESSCLVHSGTWASSVWRMVLVVLALFVDGAGCLIWYSLAVLPLSVATQHSEGRKIILPTTVDLD